MKEHKHMTYENRIVIETLLKQGVSINLIAKTIGKNSSSIYREIKKRREKLNDSNQHCSLTNKTPFICRSCNKKGGCKMIRYGYHAKNAQLNYLSKLKDTRKGIDATEDELEYLDNILKDRIVMKNQSIYHFYQTEKDNLGFSLSTIYRYIDQGYLHSMGNEHLLRKLKFKPRKKENEPNYKVDNIIRLGRKYDDYKKYINENPTANIVQMDLVIGKTKDTNCILTILFTNSNLMLMFLVNKYSTESITNVFNKLKSSLGHDRFKELFEVILTDNGWEFSKPADIEIDPKTGEKLVNVFYCNPYSSWEKGKLERNHEFIRYIIPKGISFDSLDQRKLNKMMNNINNTLRKSLKNKTPYILFKELYGAPTCNILHLQQIKKKDIDLGYKNII